MTEFKNNLDVLYKAKLFVFDLDGTINLGDKLIPGAKELVDYLLESGRDYLFFSNNSSRSRDTYVERFINLGFDMKKENIMSSADVMIAWLKEYRRGKKVFLVGNEDAKKGFEKEGIVLSDDADIVVATLDNEVNYEKLEKASILLQKGAEFFATHLDLCCPTDRGFIPDCGAICGLLTDTTGVKPRALGKPEKETVDIICELKNEKRENIVFVGDRLYTDIAVGANNGAGSCLVYTGEAKPEDLVNPSVKPDVALDSVMDIYRLLKEYDEVKNGK